VFLSQGTAGRSIRLTPRADVRGDAVRFRLRDETLRGLLAWPGRWRVAARADDRLIGEGWVDVDPSTPDPAADLSRWRTDGVALSAS
jgi:hypothetical protein